MHKKWTPLAESNDVTILGLLVYQTKIFRVSSFMMYNFYTVCALFLLTAKITPTNPNPRAAAIIPHSLIAGIGFTIEGTVVMKGPSVPAKESNIVSTTRLSYTRMMETLPSPALTQ